MNRALLARCGCLWALALVGGPSPAGAEGKGVKFEMGVFGDAACKNLKGPIDIDTSKSCVNYSYVDSKGKTYRGSVGHFRCYADRVVLLTGGRVAGAACKPGPARG